MRKLRIITLWHVSLMLCLLFMATIGINFGMRALAQNRTDAVSHAEHEQLRMEVHDTSMTEDAKVAVLSQRLADDEKLIERNTKLVDEHASTINRMEGIGISFGLALTIVQYMLFRAHHDPRKYDSESSS